MTPLTLCQSEKLPPITWEKLPADFILPDDPVDNLLQPLLAAALRESLELAGLIVESMIVATNFGICATVGDKTVVKAPDWVFVPAVEPANRGEIRRSYTPHAELPCTHIYPDLPISLISPPLPPKFGGRLVFCTIPSPPELGDLGVEIRLITKPKTCVYTVAYQGG